MRRTKPTENNMKIQRRSNWTLKNKRKADAEPTKSENTNTHKKHTECGKARRLKTTYATYSSANIVC